MTDEQSDKIRYETDLLTRLRAKLKVKTNAQLVEKVEVMMSKLEQHGNS